MTEHTPGPVRYTWTNAMPSQGRLGRLYDGETGVIVLEGPDGGFVYGSLESGSLVAAALNTPTPDLFEALVYANAELACLVADPEDPDFNPVTINENAADADCLAVAFMAIRSAIAKAKGQTP